MKTPLTVIINHADVLKILLKKIFQFDHFLYPHLDYNQLKN